MFHLVQIKCSDDGGSNPIITVPVTQGELFKFLWVIEHSSFVEQFKVNDGLDDHKSFGWGKFDKWVMKFTWDNP